MQLLKEKSGKISSVIIKVLLSVYILCVVFVAALDAATPKEIVVTREEINAVSINADNVSGVTTAGAKLFGVIPIKDVEIKVVPDTKLVPCGDVFGVKFFTKGVMVVRLSDIETGDGFVSPAKRAGLREGDVIQSINGSDVNTAEEMAFAVENSNGNDISVIYLRDDKESSCVIKPVLSLSDKKYKTGIWVRDSTAGIGTMTYYNSETGEFAGLGHGICDIDTGKLMPLLSGVVVDVEITDIIRGRKGMPGELKGSFDTVKQGEISGNTPHGVYGVIRGDAFRNGKEAMEVAKSSEVTTGKATILCELDSDGIGEYEIEITKIKNSDEEGKNFLITVTDENLLEKTGGIVQGMSGSPIIQNGKLVGAVTHVLVSDSKKGYGIFIENMMPEERED